MKKRTDSPEGEERMNVRRQGRRARFAAPAALAVVLAGGDARLGARVRESDADDDAAETDNDVDIGVREASALLRLATHPDHEVRVRLAGWLPDAIEWMSRAERTELITSWASSSDPAVRLAIARALRYASPALGSYTAIEHLSGDPDPSVRLVIAEAAWLRRREAPDRLISVLARLSDDSNAMVREVALLALGDT